MDVPVLLQPLNQERCVVNLLRSAVALLYVIDVRQAGGELLDWQAQTDALGGLLEVFNDHLEPPVRRVLRACETG